MTGFRRRSAALACACGLPALALGTVACGFAPSEPSGSGGKVVRVVAAENFWGSIASQVGGTHARVQSIVTNPNTDPHSYEPTAADARAIASASLVVENGAGYDPWVNRLLAADQGEHIAVLDVAGAVRVPAGGNPHRWYNPRDVRVVVHRLAAAYGKLNPAYRRYFARRAAIFLSLGLHRYYSLISGIRSAYAGTPVGASESIVAMLAPALGLRLVTPPSFLRAISEGTEVSAADKQTIDNQIRHHRIRIYMYNSQNLTPDVRAQVAAARAAHIPVVPVTETLTPPDHTFQDWQIGQLERIRSALATATGH